MDIIFIERLAVDTVIGVYDWERTATQKLYLDVQMAWDIKPAASSDNIALTLDYAAVSEYIQQFAQAKQYELVETFAEVLTREIMDRFNVPWLRLKITKPAAVPAAAGVGAEIERGCR